MTKQEIKQINLENKKKRDDFVNSQEVKIVDVSNVVLKEQTHINAISSRGVNAELNKQVEKLREKNITILNNPIIVKQEEANTYSLIQGFKGYFIAKSLKHEQIPVVVATNKSRKDFIKNIGFKSIPIRTMNIKDIIIPTNFQQSGVSVAKIKKAIKYYNKYGRFDKPVTINRTNLLIDGYARYMAADMLGIKKVSVRYE